MLKTSAALGEHVLRGVAGGIFLRAVSDLITLTSGAAEICFLILCWLHGRAAQLIVITLLHAASVI